MIKRFWTIIVFLALTACSAGKTGIVESTPAPLPTLSTEGFMRVLAPRDFIFPQDQGPHPEFQTEWWYFTGNLQSANGGRYGYQLTFFRRALLPPKLQTNRPSTWASDQVYMAHFAVTSVQTNEFRAFERFSRGAAGLAGATGIPLFNVWLDDWSVIQLSEKEYRLKAGEGSTKLEIDLTDQKGIILQGENGLSQKGSQPGNASYYLSQSRLATSGIVTINGIGTQVQGTSWMDHEFGTSALDQGQIGWDWFALQLNDGSELMVYTIRQKDGSIDPYSRGILILPDHTTRQLNADQFKIQVLSTWKSPSSQAVYPSEWQITIPSLALSLKVKPVISNQELRVSFTYWEGAVDIGGSREGIQITGVGYAELTGYSASMEGQF